MTTYETELSRTVQVEILEVPSTMGATTMKLRESSKTLERMWIYQFINSIVKGELQTYKAEARRLKLKLSNMSCTVDGCTREVSPLKCLNA